MKSPSLSASSVLPAKPEARELSMCFRRRDNKQEPKQYGSENASSYCASYYDSNFALHNRHTLDCAAWVVMMVDFLTVEDVDEGMAET